MISDRLPEIATASILAVPAAFHALLAETALQAPEWVGSLTQVSAFGLVAWIVYYMFTKWLPNIQAAHSAQMAEQRTAHMEAMKLVADAHATAVTQMSDAFTESLKQQRIDLLALRFSCRAPETKQPSKP